jgi:hypothetical protein
VHSAAWVQHAAQSAETNVRLSKMMENSSTHDVIEAHAEVTHLFNGKLMDMKVL